MTTRPERRKAPRVSGPLRLAIAEGATELVAETKNLSISGAYCTLNRFIPPMTKLALQFELPYAPQPVRVRCTGVVVRIEPLIDDPTNGRYHIAIFFSELSERDRSAISQFVQQRLAASHPTS